jgi:conjugal transfer pilus assembly protein TraK
MAKTESVTASEEAAPDADETAVRLIQAMASQEIVPGYRMRRSALVPVQAGDLTVQLVAEYEGLDVVGRVVRIENSSSAPIEITEGRIAPSDALAVSIANPKLAPRQATSAYVVTGKEGS